MNSGMPPRSRNHRLPAACDTPTATAASSLDNPRAISHQNLRSTSRRNAGAPGDFIADRPVNAFIHPAGRPINTSIIEMLRRPVESTQFTSWSFTHRVQTASLMPSLGTVGDAFDNAMMESFWSKLQTEFLDRKKWKTRIELANEIFQYLEIFHNRQRRHSKLGYLTPVEYERLHNVQQPA